MKIDIRCYCGAELKAVKSDVRESALTLMVGPCDNRMAHIDIETISQWHIQLLLESVLDGCVRHAIAPRFPALSHHIFDVWAKAYLFFSGHALWFIDTETTLSRSSFFIGVVVGDFLSVRYYHRPKQVKKSLFVFNLRECSGEETQEINYIAIKEMIDYVERYYAGAKVCQRKTARRFNDTGWEERKGDRDELEVIRIDERTDGEVDGNRECAEEHGEHA